jgi:hypothetical protein
MANYTAADTNGISKWLLPLVEPMKDAILFNYRADLRERLYSLSRPERLLLDAMEMEIEIRVRKHTTMKFGSVMI